MRKITPTLDPDSGFGSITLLAVAVLADVAARLLTETTPGGLLRTRFREVALLPLRPSEARIQVVGYCKTQPLTQGRAARAPSMRATSSRAKRSSCSAWKWESGR